MNDPIEPLSQYRLKLVAAAAVAAGNPDDLDQLLDNVLDCFEDLYIPAYETYLVSFLMFTGKAKSARHAKILLANIEPDLTVETIRQRWCRAMDAITECIRCKYGKS